MFPCNSLRRSRWRRENRQQAVMVETALDWKPLSLPRITHLNASKLPWLQARLAWRPARRPARMPPGPTEVAGTSGQFWPTTGPEHRFAPSRMGGYVTQTPATVDNLRWRTLSPRDRHKNATRPIGPTALRDHGKMLDMIEGQGVGRLQADGPAPPSACTAKCFECQSF